MTQEIPREWQEQRKALQATGGSTDTAARVLIESMLSKSAGSPQWELPQDAYVFSALSAAQCFTRQDKDWMIIRSFIGKFIWGDVAGVSAMLEVFNETLLKSKKDEVFSGLCEIKQEPYTPLHSDWKCFYELRRFWPDVTQESIDKITASFGEECGIALSGVPVTQEQKEMAALRKQGYDRPEKDVLSHEKYLGTKGKLTLLFNFETRRVHETLTTDAGMAMSSASFDDYAASAIDKATDVFKTLGGTPLPALREVRKMNIDDFGGRS